MAVDSLVTAAYEYLTEHAVHAHINDALRNQSKTSALLKRLR